jgi:hypothetical protein
MQFSKDSELFLGFLIDGFSTFIKKETRLEQKPKDNIFKMLFYDLNASYNEAKQLDIYKNMDLSTKTLQPPKLGLSSFVPPNVRKQINEQIGKIIQYKSNITVKKGTNFEKHKIEINFIVYDDDFFNEKFDKYNLYITTWLKMAFMYSSGKCSKELKIFIYLTDEKKSLPSRYVQILRPENCNSAVTTGCMDSTEIIIYRKEEWFKVLIHETFHCLGLDLSNFKSKEFNFEEKLKEIFPLNFFQKGCITEAYAEFWATILNCLFCSHILLDKNIKKKEELIEQFLQYSTFCIKFEQIFSIFQLIKILNFMGIQYKHLYEKNDTSVIVRNHLYKEKTNVFAYYILKCLFLFYYNDFIVWCNKNNNNFSKLQFGDRLSILRFHRTPDNLRLLLKFIKEKYNKPDFLNVLENMKLFIAKLKSTKGDHDEKSIKKLFSTTRMSVCELVIE